MTRPERTVTHRGILLAVAFACAALVAACDDQLLPPETLPAATFAGRILYTRSVLGEPDKIMSYRTESDGPVLVTEGILSSASQQGKIAYYRESGSGGAGVYVRDLNGDDTLRALDDPIYAPIEPTTVTLAPDGTTVAFIAISFSMPELHIATPYNDLPVSLYDLDISRSDMLHIWFDQDVTTILVAGVSLSTGAGVIYAVDPVSGYAVQAADFSNLSVTGIDLFQDGFQLAMTTADQGIMFTDTSGPGFYYTLLPGRDYAAPLWSPDQRSILFTAPDTDGGDLYMVGLSDTKVERITRTPESEMYGAWALKGAAILYTVPSGAALVGTGLTTGQLMLTDVATKETTLIDNDVYRGFWSEQ